MKKTTARFRSPPARGEREQGNTWLRSCPLSADKVPACVCWVGRQAEARETEVRCVRCKPQEALVTSVRSHGIKGPRVFFKEVLGADVSGRAPEGQGNAPCYVSVEAFGGGGGYLLEDIC